MLNRLLIPFISIPAIIFLAACSVPQIPLPIQLPAATPTNAPTSANRAQQPNLVPPRARLRPAPETNGGANCARTSVGLTPLTDLGNNAYKGYAGGLYPNGSNTPPADYLKVGFAHAQNVRALNSAGQADANGKIVLLSIGMSNTTQEFSEFKREADADQQKNPYVTIVDGAQGGQDAEMVKNPNARFWNGVEQRLGQAGFSDAQVQVVWLKEAIANANENFPNDARTLQNDLRAIIQILTRRYPNLQIVYVSSRTYAGYAVTHLNPEPFAYQSGFAVKWLIEDNIKSGAQSPWLAWGPYLWTDGTQGRNDGFIWECNDTREDGTHPSPTSGVQKIAGLVSKFFKSDETAKVWYVR